ncbi:ea8f093d-25fc-404d-ac15-b37ea0cac454 [Sclerotinia trifoliorum]|uniref:Ea8f093d-25fc-404d-ac15-b37ea0cac454 n=1 Tax=Sclerotinia trifoliorum TaxID=28548 RepID=A0A8H2W2Y4_9HELO|nr:ea8f093d-25fc-404d-ac15-b37ea0cac454 [Sclerotinia trifoliorum]
MSHPMVVLPSNGSRHLHGIKREHDHDHVYEAIPKNTNGSTTDTHTHQHKKKKNHHHQHRDAQQNGEGEKKKRQRSKRNSRESQEEEDTLMSGGLGETSAELGEPILPPARDSHQSTPTMHKAMREKHRNASESKKKKSKSKGPKAVHFEGLSNGHTQNGGEKAEAEGAKMNGDPAQRRTSILPVRSHIPILPQTSSPILPPIRPRRYSSNGQTPILPPASPSRLNLLRVSPIASTPILPPTSPFRKRRRSTGNAFSQPPPTFSVESPSLQASLPASSESAEPKRKDDDWEFSTGKIRAMVGNPMEKDAQREENIAFSSNYIRSPMRQSQGINVAGVNFNTIYLKSRETIVLKDKNNGLQVCSVAQGSIWVSLGTEKFRISKGGMWRVREGEKCSVKNQDSQECILHMTSIPSASALI